MNLSRSFLLITGTLFCLVGLVLLASNVLRMTRSVTVIDPPAGVVVYTVDIGWQKALPLVIPIAFAITGLVALRTWQKGARS